MARTPQLTQADLDALAHQAEELTFLAMDLSDRAERAWPDAGITDVPERSRMINAAVRALAQLNGVLMARMAMDADRAALRQDLSAELRAQ